MKLAYLVQCHKNPDQINRMINALSHRDAHFYVHVDKKSSIKQTINKRDDVFFVDDSRRVCVRWAHASLVDAMLTLLEISLKGHFKYDYYWFISGQDYPIRATEEIIRFFEKHAGEIFMKCSQDDKFNRRCLKRNLLWYPDWIILPTLLGRIFLKMYIMVTGGPQHTFGWAQRKEIFPGKYFFGETWFTITHSAAVYVLDYLKKNPRYRDFFEGTVNTAESFFHTILSNSPFRKNITDYLCYVDWSGHKKNPKILTLEDYDKLIHSEYLIARKFDDTVDAQILDRLDQHNGL